MLSRAILVHLFIPVILCHPLIKSNLGSELKKDEKQYPNGTVVGKYSYTDSEGNPVQLRYFADNASYGIELKSVKAVNSTSDNPTTLTFQETTDVGKLLLDTEESMTTPSTLYDTNYSNTKSKVSNNDNTKAKHRASPDYEVYYQNELRTSKKCGKDKVRVYLGEEKRKIREASLSYVEAAKYCEHL